MATPLFSRLLSRIPLPRRTPLQPMGVRGTPLYGGYPLTAERSPKLIGQEKYRTFADILANTSIVAAGMRYFLNIVAKPTWSCEPADDSDAAKEAADFVSQILFEDLNTPWSRVVRRMGTYRFYGFAVQEWTAEKRDDGKVGFSDIDSRPQYTIQRWEVDERGVVTGMWQRDPLTGKELGLPRDKVVYLVDDTLSDSPEGLGLLRHVVEPCERLAEYQKQEGFGFLRDLRGIPVGRAPLDELTSAVNEGTITKADQESAIQRMLDFVKLERKSSDTALLLNSQPYLNRGDTGDSVSATPKWNVELISGQAPGLTDVGQAIIRLNTEIARILGIEHMMLGSEGAGSYALAKEKATNLYLLANSVLRDIRLQSQTDLVWQLWNLNGLPDETMPNLKAEDVAPKDILQIAAVLRDMAVAGAPVAPDDEVQNFVRDLIGAPHIDLTKMQGLSPEALLGIQHGPTAGLEPQAMQDQKIESIQAAAEAKAKFQPGKVQSGRAAAGGTRQPIAKKRLNGLDDQFVKMVEEAHAAGYTIMDMIKHLDDNEAALIAKGESIEALAEIEQLRTWLLTKYSQGGLSNELPAAH